MRGLSEQAFKDQSPRHHVVLKLGIAQSTAHRNMHMDHVSESATCVSHGTVFVKIPVIICAQSTQNPSNMVPW